MGRQETRAIAYLTPAKDPWNGSQILNPRATSARGRPAPDVQLRDFRDRRGSSKVGQKIWVLKDKGTVSLEGAAREIVHDLVEIEGLGGCRAERSGYM